MCICSQKMEAATRGYLDTNFESSLMALQQTQPQNVNCNFEVRNLFSEVRLG